MTSVWRVWRQMDVRDVSTVVMAGGDQSASWCRSGSSGAELPWVGEAEAGSSDLEYDLPDCADGGDCWLTVHNESKVRCVHIPSASKHASCV